MASSFPQHATSPKQVTIRVTISFLDGTIVIEPERAHLEVGTTVQWVFQFDGVAPNIPTQLLLRFPRSSPFARTIGPSSILVTVPLGAQRAVHQTRPATVAGEHKYDVVASNAGTQVEEDPWLIVV